MGFSMSLVVRIIYVHLYYKIYSVHTTQKTRFDTRIPKDQKDLFQRAAELGGFKTLSEFVIYSAKVQAELIVKKHESIVTSKKDTKIFFDAIINPPPANKELKKAVSSYNKRVGIKSVLTVPLENAHKKKNFDCGRLSLNNYLHFQAKQDMKRRLSVCFVLADDLNKVDGYYTLSNALYPERRCRKKLNKNYPLLMQIASHITWPSGGRCNCQRQRIRKGLVDRCAEKIL